MFNQSLIESIIKLAKKPNLYEPGTHMMWTEPYIQPFLLEAHLSNHTDAASRKQPKIEKIVEFILVNQKNKSKILDLGCGPGLYLKEMAKYGHETYGIDFSQYSLDYAEKINQELKLNMKLIHGDYILTPFPKDLDIISLIYCDFGVLSDQNQKILLSKVHQSLNKEGFLVLDFYNENKRIMIKESNDFEIEEKGFWRPHPHIVLNQTFHYEDQMAFLDQHIVMDENLSVYRFYNHYYTDQKIIEMMKNIGFSSVEIYHDIIDEKEVSFLKAYK